ncbi:aquaporin-3-like [Neosynchiropus ocellatus]
MSRQNEVLQKLAAALQIQHLLLRQALAECLGTLILVMFGCGAVAQWVLSGASHGTFLSVNFAFGCGATLGILVSGGISGGHLNPAVTFTLCVLGREPWRKFPLFFVFQTLGAFLGAAIIYCMYFEALWDFGDGELVVVGRNATAGIFATYPSQHLSLFHGAVDQVIGSAALILCVLAIVDPLNKAALPRGLEAFTVGLVVLVVGLSMGFNCGYAVNPARDLGPRILTALAGWGREVFTVNSYWFLVPICAPFLGALVGVMMYQLMIGYHLEGEELQQKKQEGTEEEVEERLKLSCVSWNEEA